MGVYEADRHPHLHEEMRLVERAVAAGVPVLGVCLGSQLVAAALGAKVTRAPRREIGWREVRLREPALSDALFSDAPASFQPLHWHGDVFELPPGAVSLATSELTEHQAFRSGERTWGLLFHMEMRPAEVAAMASTFEADLTAEGMRRGDVVGPAEERTASLAPFAGRVFAAWASLIEGAKPPSPGAPKADAQRSNCGEGTTNTARGGSARLRERRRSSSPRSAPRTRP
jgi:GMP synthase (glutamine-hydrolysing)